MFSHQHRPPLSVVYQQLSGCLAWVLSFQGSAFDKQDQPPFKGKFILLQILPCVKLFGETGREFPFQFHTPFLLKTLVLILFSWIRSFLNKTCVF